MKRISKIIVMLLAIVAVLSVFAACNSVTGIKLDDSDKPRATYVLGQDLDLSKGKIVIESSKGAESVALNAAGVSVSGYDKNKLGKQTVTVAYEGFNAEFEVNVVNRIEAESVTKTYLVGDTFNKAQGQLRITNDDGSSFIVLMSDSSVTVENFDSSAPAQGLELTVKYVKDSVSYTGSYKINVYDYDDTRFVKPNKITYRSHETEIDLSGGYLQFSANGGALSKTVTLEDCDVAGFDPSQATAANRTEPLKQEITLTYNGVDYKYTISIVYSDISVIQEYAAKLSSLSWSGTQPPEISEELGENALEAMKLYFSLAEADQKAVSESDLSTVLRAAVVYGNSKYQSILESYKNTFVVNNGSLLFDCSDREKVKSDYERLIAPEPDLYAISSVLVNILKNFGKDVLLGEITVEKYLSNVYDYSFVDNVIDIVEYMLALYDKLAEIPDDWTAATLNSYATQIASAVSTIERGKFTSNTYRSFYDIVSSWRTKNDFFEIIYTYYYNTNNMDALKKVKDVHLYGKLEELFGCLYDAIILTTRLNVNVMQISILDSTNLMYLYNKSLTLMDELDNSADKMEADLYDTLTFGNVPLGAGGTAMQASYGDLLQFLKTTKYGYYDINSNVLGNEQVEALWADYLAMFDKYSTQPNYLKSQEYITAAEKLLQDYVALSPTWQYAFLTSINPYYEMAIPAVSFDYSQGVYNNFVYFIANCYEAQLKSASSKSIFRDLLVAAEYYARRYTSVKASDGSTVNFVTEFANVMERVNKNYGTLNMFDKSEFDDKLGFMLEKYNNIYNKYVKPSTPVKTELGEWQAAFDELVNRIWNLNATLAGLNSTNPTIPNNDYLVMVAAYEAVREQIKYIETTAPANIRDALYYEDYKIFSNSTFSLDFTAFIYHADYTNYLCGTNVKKGANTYSLYDLYSVGGLKQFMPQAYSVMIRSVNNARVPELDSAAVKAVMDAFLKLDLGDKWLMLVADTASLYYGGLNAYLRELMTANAAAVAAKFFEFERANVFYEVDKDGKYSDGTTYLAKKTEAENAVKSAYAGLSAEDKASFDAYLSAAYNAYFAK